jgi:hypothetical protein
MDTHIGTHVSTCKALVTVEHNVDNTHGDELVYGNPPPPEIMTTSRAESINQPPYGRKRSNTVQSFLRSPVTPITPLCVGDSQVLSLWVHDAATQGNDVIFNSEYWPGAAEGDMIRVTAVPADGEELSLREQIGFLFIVQNHDNRTLNNQLQVRYRSYFGVYRYD